MSALVEEAVSVGDLVRLFTFRQSNTNIVELTLPDSSPFVGTLVREVPWPSDSSLVAVLRDGQVHQPDPEATLEAHDELLFVTSPETEEDLAQLLAPHTRPHHGRTTD